MAAIDIDVDQLLEQMEQIPNDRFPEMLFSPVINQFEDDIGKNYWTDFDESNELIDRAMTIGGKTRDYNKYLDELEVWNEYMSSLAEKYGSIEIVEAAAEDGVIPEFVPKKPSLKMTKRNKLLIKSGVVPSRKSFKPTYIGLYGFMDQSGEIDSEWEEITEDNMFQKMDKASRKAIKKYLNKHMVRDRMEMYTNSTTKNDAFATINEFYNTFGERGYRRQDDEFTSLTQLQKERERIENTPDHLLDEMFDTSYSGIDYVYGKFTDTRKSRKLDIVKDMIELGYDPFRLGAAEGISKKEIKLIATDMSDVIPDNVKKGKMWKKLNKKKKKERKKLAKHTTQNSNIARLINNSFSVSDTEFLTNWTWNKDDLDD